MRTLLLGLASALALSLTPLAWASGSPPPAVGASTLIPTRQVGVSMPPGKELAVTGELRTWRHIDRVTGRGAISLHVGGQEIPLDFRQFDKDILLWDGPHILKGHWSPQQRLVVTEARPVCRG